MTAQELLEYSHESYRTELIAGRLVEMEPTGAQHGVVAATLSHLLRAHVLPLDLGKVFGAQTGYILASDPDTVRAPDASFVSRERIEALGGVPAGYWPGPPEIAFEVTSPNDRRAAVRCKTDSWLQAGTRVVVVVDPQRATAVVHRRDAPPQLCSGAETLDLADVLPGFAPSVADVLA